MNFMLLSTPMAEKAIVKKKTQTRRVVTEPQFHKMCENLKIRSVFTGEAFNTILRLWNGDYWPEILKACKYTKGEKLSLRETWQLKKDGEWWYGKWQEGDEVFFRAGFDGDNPPKVWRPSIHLPDRLARYLIRIENIRLQRLHDVTEQDAVAESFVSVAEFKDYWNQLNVRRGYGWESNNLVWVYDFELESK